MNICISWWFLSWHLCRGWAYSSRPCHHHRHHQQQQQQQHSHRRGRRRPCWHPTPPPSQDTLPAVERSDCSTEYTSRYLTDFEPVQRLARGGLGVVCRVRNKLDENEYAVKRINLPTNKSSAERVKREVRALAKFNHANIVVRCYNSWPETPPPGWQDPQDAVHSQQVSCVCVRMFVCAFT
ncbi:eukaryotic translation initiation factor 2-alpha kinase-like [Scylla paramamosain]|uniref:eukaryotic translation initiation factor 2-alpha kinase-like n=1 Tax=Scylla paramamosain TaxID=85552 RepID=UPI0030831BE2